MTASEDSRFPIQFRKQECSSLISSTAQSRWTDQCSSHNLSIIVCFPRNWESLFRFSELNSCVDCRCRIAPGRLPAEGTIQECRGICSVRGKKTVKHRPGDVIPGLNSFPDGPPAECRKTTTPDEYTRLGDSEIRPPTSLRTGPRRRQCYIERDSRCCQPGSYFVSPSSDLPQLIGNVRACSPRPVEWEKNSGPRPRMTRGWDFPVESIDCRRYACLLGNFVQVCLASQPIVCGQSLLNRCARVTGEGRQSPRGTASEQWSLHFSGAHHAC